MGRPCGRQVERQAVNNSVVVTCRKTQWTTVGCERVERWVAVVGVSSCNAKQDNGSGMGERWHELANNISWVGMHHMDASPHLSHLVVR